MIYLKDEPIGTCSRLHLHSRTAHLPIYQVKRSQSQTYIIDGPVIRCPADTHLKRDQNESNLSVPGIRGCRENALYKSFKTSPSSICLYTSINIPLGPA